MVSMGKIQKLYQAKNNMSFAHFLLFCLRFPLRKYRTLLFKRVVLRASTLEDRFTRIYQRKAWGSKESVSGPGSTLEMTIPIRKELPIVFDKFSIKSIFDAPCGDFYWMRLVNLDGVLYTGGDIVRPLIDDLNKKYESEAISFIQMDITKSRFPKSDLVLNRDCLFHLSYLDILSVLSNFIASDSKYFLSTSHDKENNFSNFDITSADFRLIDLFAEPFCFPQEYLYKISESSSLPSRHLYLWNREQVMKAHENLTQFLEQV
jgi:hypothetical protein